ncbi:MAG: alpha/beta fold hydrolase [Alphaproteobacteria bacterium]
MRRGYADTPMGQIHYQCAGEGPALMLLPGAGQTHHIFKRLMAILARRYRVVAVDALGTGNSDPLPAKITFQDLAASCVHVLDALEIDRAHIYGIHTGNKIGAAVAAHWPGRTGNFVFVGQSHSVVADRTLRNAHMLAVTSHYFALDGVDPNMRPILQWADAYKRATNLWWSGDLLRAGVVSAATADVRAQIVDMLQSYDGARRMYEANFAYDLEADLRRLSCRTLIVEIATPAEDDGIGRQGPALLQIVPRSKLVTFEEPDGLGLTLDNRAEELAAVLFDFLGQA